MIELNDQQRQALEASEGTAVIIETNTPYVLVRKDLYERLRCNLETDDVRMMEPLLAVTDPGDWEDLSNYDSKP